MTNSNEIEAMERELAWIRKEIEVEQELETYAGLILSAHAKLEKLVFGALTPEERLACDGMYLFVHGGMVDLVKDVPSPTDRGEGARVAKILKLAALLRLQKSQVAKV